MKFLKKGLPVLSLLVLLVVWQVVAVFLSSNLLPTPAVVVKVFWQECVSGQLPYHLGVTLLRLLVSFSVAMLLGCALGIVLGRNKKLDAFFAQTGHRVDAPLKRLCI